MEKDPSDAKVGEKWFVKLSELIAQPVTIAANTTHSHPEMVVVQLVERGGSGKSWKVKVIKTDQTKLVQPGDVFESIPATKYHPWTGT
jgi:hypothetical protein